MFLQEHCVVTVSGAQFRHDVQAQERKERLGEQSSEVADL